MTAVYIVIALVVVGVIIFYLRFANRRSRQKDFRMEDREAWARRWTELEAMLNEGESHWQVAIIEADKLFDRVLKSMHLPGTTMGERLKFLTRSRPELRYVWEAHLVRNRLAHESNFYLTRRTTADTLQTFKKAFRDLGVL